MSVYRIVDFSLIHMELLIHRESVYPCVQTSINSNYSRYLAVANKQFGEFALDTDIFSRLPLYSYMLFFMHRSVPLCTLQFAVDF
jgi:hypothetical protein